MEKKQPLWQNPWAWIIGVVVLWLATFAVLWICSDDGITSARVGDAFQCANALFAGLALAGMVYAILLQRVELRLQREELHLQRQEMKDTRAELKRQANAAEQQQRVLEAQRRATLLSAAISGTAGLAQASRIAPNTLVDTAILEHLRDLINSALEELNKTPVAQPEGPLPSVR